MNEVLGQLLQNNGFSSLKELGKAISDEKILKKVQKLKTIPNEGNDFTKVLKYKDQSFLHDMDLQKKLGSLIFTQAELKKIKRNDYIYAISYAYLWVYGYKDEEGNWKITPNTADINLDFTQAETETIIEAKDSEVFEIVGVKIEDLTEWEQDLVMEQVKQAIFDPAHSVMGLVSSL